MALRLRRLKILRFRDVRPGTTLRFNDGWNVVLGRNATGKTTLLNLISMALRGDFRELNSESFAIEYEVVDDDLSLEVSVQNEVSPRDEFNPLAMLQPRDTAEHRGSLTATLTTSSGRVRFGPPQPHDDEPHYVALDPRLELSPGVTVYLAPQEMHIDVNQWLREILRAFRFDEALELFRVILGGESDAPSMPSAALSAILFGDNGAFSPLLPMLQFAATWTTSTAGDDITAIQGNFEACPNLSWAVRQLGASALHAMYAVTEIKKNGGSTVATLGAPTITLRRPDGSAVSVKQLSFGQRRLFTFAWYLDANAGPVIADELVNGMHYEWIDECVRAMEGRQKFITAQNPLLLDHVELSSREDVSHSFVLCRAERTADGRREVVWSNPSEEQSAEFHRAYENGVMKVHEILRSEGLW